MAWQDEVWRWLVHSAVFGAMILALGGIAVWLCHQPVYRIRWIQWTLAGCLLVPAVQQFGYLPQLSLPVLPASFAVGSSGGHSSTDPVAAGWDGLLTQTTSFDTRMRAERAAIDESSPADALLDARARHGASVCSAAPMSSRIDEPDSRAGFQAVSRGGRFDR